MAGGFNANTRQFYVQLPNLIRPSGGGSSVVELPDSGFLARIWLLIQGGHSTTTQAAVTGVCYADMVRRLTLRLNDGNALFDCSGRGFHYGIRDLLEDEYMDHFGQLRTTGDLAQYPDASGDFEFGTEPRAQMVNAGVDVWWPLLVPCMVNYREPVGLIPLQNAWMSVSLGIEWETTANTTQAEPSTQYTASPILELYTVPPIRDPRKPFEDWPDVTRIHQILETTQSYSAGQEVVYQFPRGGTLLQLVHIFQAGLPGSSPGLPKARENDITTKRWRVNQSNYIVDFSGGAKTVRRIETLFWYGYHGRPRPEGTVVFDLLASSGLGSYGSYRDTFDTVKVTDVVTIVQMATNAGIQSTVRRQMLPVAGMFPAGPGQAG